jgi:N-acetylglucosaminyldiphosphoundecaprenol N-acetyl-beta-D-mannosaminyltransferase
MAAPNWRSGKFPQINLFNLPLACVTRDEVVNLIFDALSQRRGGWLVTVNVDRMRRYCLDPQLGHLCSGADLVVADGMPVLWASRLRRTPLPDRVAGSDLVWLLAERAAGSGRSLYLLGGVAGAADGAAQRLRHRWPALRIAGTSEPTVSSVPTADELDALRSSLAEAQPDIVYVGLGAPKEERVIGALRGDFAGAWWIGIGISLSFMAGAVPRAPRWMQRAGLEWLHRMIQEPKRLTRRYLVDDLPFLFQLLVRAWRTRM